MIRKTAVLLCLALFCCLLFGCGETAKSENAQPQHSYLGTWKMTLTGNNPVTATISEDAIELTIEGETQIFNGYTVSQDNMYTYLEHWSNDTEGLVFVWVNWDMMCWGFIGEAKLQGTTGMGTLFDASFSTIGQVLIKSTTRSQTQWPLADSVIQNQPFYEQITAFSYYPDAGIMYLYTAEGLCDGAFYVFNENSVRYAENISIVNARGTSPEWIQTNHGFVITDIH